MTADCDSLLSAYERAGERMLASQRAADATLAAYRAALAVVAEDTRAYIRAAEALRDFFLSDLAAADPGRIAAAQSIEREIAQRLTLQQMGRQAAQEQMGDTLRQWLEPAAN